MEHAKRFRAMLAEFGLSHLEAAKLLHVSLRTLQNWLSGRHEVPYAAYKLVRLLRYMELPGASWRGWHFSRGFLVTPEGRTISGNEGAWWSMLVRQAQCFHSMYQRSGGFERALMELAAQGPLAGTLSGRHAVPASGMRQRAQSGGGVAAPAGVAGGVPQAPRPNLLIEHFTESGVRDFGKVPSYRGETGKPALPGYKVNISYGGKQGVRP